MNRHAVIAVEVVWDYLVENSSADNLITRKEIAEATGLFDCSVNNSIEVIRDKLAMERGYFYIATKGPGGGCALLDQAEYESEGEVYTRKGNRELAVRLKRYVTGTANPVQTLTHDPLVKLKYEMVIISATRLIEDLERIGKG